MKEKLKYILGNITTRGIEYFYSFIRKVNKKHPCRMDNDKSKGFLEAIPTEGMKSFIKLYLK